MAAAVGLSVASAQDGASGAGGQTDQTGASSSMPLDDQGTGHGVLLGPGTGVPDAGSHGS